MTVSIRVLALISLLGGCSTTLAYAQQSTARNDFQSTDHAMVDTDEAQHVTLKHGKRVDLKLLDDTVSDIVEAGCSVEVVDGFRPGTIQAIIDGEIVATGRDPSSVGGTLIRICNGMALDLY